MSDHARLFASAVPGNGSSNTFAENESDSLGLETNSTPAIRDAEQSGLEIECISQRGTSPDAEIGDESGENSIIERRQRVSPEDDITRERHTIEDKCIEHMDEIVESFRSNEITKLKALSTIVSILDLNPSRTERATSGKGVFSHSYRIKIIAEYSTHRWNCVPYPWRVYLKRVIESMVKGVRYIVKDRLADKLSSSAHPMKNGRNTMRATMTIKSVL
jgi:hypothetical protein